MLHFSCDLCGHQLDDRRFIIKLEVFPAFDPEALTEEDLDVDHLEEVAEMIEELESTGDMASDQSAAKSFRYDLCPACHQKFLRDPLGRDSLRRLNFSEN